MLKVSTISKVVTFVALCASVAHADVTKDNIIYSNQLAGKNQVLGSIKKVNITYGATIEKLLNQSWKIMAKPGTKVWGAIPISDEVYNFPTANLEIGPAVRMSLYATLRDTGACALVTKETPDRPGPCLVIDQGPNGAVQSYFVGSIKYPSGLTRIFRKDVKSPGNVALTKRISAIENGQLRIYSHVAEASVVVVPAQEKREETGAVEAPVVVEEPVVVDAISYEKRDAKARVRYAILNKLPIDRETLMKAITIESEVERTQEEKAASGVRREMVQLDLSDFSTRGYATCYVGGKIDRPAVWGIRADALTGKYSSENKVSINCYKDGLLVIHMNAILKQKESLTLGWRPGRTKALAGAFGIGKIDGVIDIVTTKLENGGLLAYRKTPCVFGVDVLFVGLSGLCVPSGREQRVTVGAQGRIQEPAGVTVSVFPISRLGLDPDDF